MRNLLFRSSILTKVEMSEIATHNLPASARSKRAISEHAQEHAPHFSAGSVLDIIKEEYLESKELPEKRKLPFVDCSNLVSYLGFSRYVKNLLDF